MDLSLRSLGIAPSPRATPRERAAVRVLELALFRPTLPPAPGPSRLTTALRRYRVTRPLLAGARIVAESFWREAWPCCWGHRYGHGWTRWERFPLTRGGSELDLNRVPDLRPGWLPVQVTRERRGDRLYGLVTDFELLAQGPPAPCPDCGKEAPRRERERWAAHVAARR